MDDAVLMHVSLSVSRRTVIAAAMSQVGEYREEAMRKEDS